MSIEAIKYHTCWEDDSEAVLLVDIETEEVPDTDRDGNLQYYCIEGRHTFSVDEDEEVDDDEE